VTAPRVQLFLSTVSAEFRSYRDALRDDLERPNVTVKVQEQFIATGTETLDKLDDYIRACDAVVHVAGDMTGAWAEAPAVAAIRARYPDLAERLPAVGEALENGTPLSYTQWEGYLAVYHRKVLLIATPEPSAPRDPTFRADDAQRAAQRAHLDRLRALGRYPEISFANADRLTVAVLRSKLHDILARTAGPTKPVVLPYPSLGPLFKGREEILRRLRASLESGGAGRATAIAAKALHGLGGVGKTRLAVEYAWRHADDYSALLLVTADSPEALHRNLAALCEERALDLPEREAAEEAVRTAAAVRWLQEHPGWLLILDNVDTPEAAAAAEDLLAELRGGHVLLTGRLSSWSAQVEALELDLLVREDAVEFLLARTDGRRRKRADDDAQAGVLAEELGRLALALEQAGAYIAHRRLDFAGYLREWRERRDHVLAWYDERLMQYPKSLAVTWQTSFDQLSDPARSLLDRLAWLAPEPIPESLLDVPVPAAGAAPATQPPGSEIAPDPGAALAELATYSLVNRAADQPAFAVHRLVQEVTRRSQRDAPGHPSLVEALGWVDAAFVGNPQDVRTWPTLIPLAPHARAVAGHGDSAGIASPTVRLMNQLGQLFDAQALYREAEPLMVRALSIDERSYGPDHPRVATHLNNLAQLLKATNRLVEAELLMRRALSIDERSCGADHPRVATRLNNLAQLLKATNRLEEAEPLMRRALSIDERSYGADHPDVARDLTNLAALLQETNRLEEAEPIKSRALSIDERSYGADHPRVAIQLSNLAQLLKARSRLEEAEPLMRRALSIAERSYGPDHPAVAINLNNLAALLQARNRLEEAEPLIRRALSIDEQSYGADHPAVAVRLNNLAALLKETNRLKEAEQLVRRALSIDKRSYGADHPQVARDLNNLAQLLKARNRLEEAEPLMRRALSIAERSYGPDHPDVAINLNNLAGLLQETTRLEEAEPLMRRALSILETSLGSNHPNTEAVRGNLDALEHAIGRL